METFVVGSARLRDSRRDLECEKRIFDIWRLGPALSKLA